MIGQLYCRYFKRLTYSFMDICVNMYIKCTRALACAKEKSSRTYTELIKYTNKYFLLASGLDNSVRGKLLR